MSNKMSLSNVTSGKRQAPFKVVLYGPPGIGKSTFAAGAPSPIFLAEPGGTDELDVQRFPRPDSWLDVLEAIDTLKREKHPYKTFVLDTADWIEPMIWDHLCRTAPKPVSNIEEYGGGYQKGYVAAMDLWRLLLARLEDLRDRGMNTIVLAHTIVKNFKNPVGEDYDFFQMKVHEKAVGLLYEWPMALLFATFETYTHKGKGDAKPKALGDGSRVVHTEPRPAWKAKNRYGLPEAIPLSWDDFERLARNPAPVSADELLAQIEELLAQVDAATAEQGKAARERCGGDPKKLTMLVDWLRSRVSKASTQAA